MFKIELFWHLNCVLMLNWIGWNRTVLTSKVCTYAKLNFLKYNCFDIKSVYCQVRSGCRIHWLHLCRGVRCPNEFPGYVSKQSHGEVLVMLEFWGMQSTPSLALLPSPLFHGMVAPDKVLPFYWLNRTNCILMLKWIVLN